MSDVNAIVALVSVTPSVGALVIVVSGQGARIVQVCVDDEASTLPAESIARTRNVCWASDSEL